jgi:alpha-glucosidase
MVCALAWVMGQICSHAKILRFSMSGQPYSACDMTSPSATVLVRQYQNAVFLPIMRVHQMHGVPRFPFHWCGANAAGGGTPAHCDAFRTALEMRYRFLPHLYSLAHDLFRRGRPIVRPASFEFPGLQASVYMVGDSILPADVSTSNGPDPLENVTQVFLPEGFWYRFNTTEAVPGNRQVIETVGLAEFPIYIRPGAILTLQQVGCVGGGEVVGRPGGQMSGVCWLANRRKCVRQAVVQYSDLIGGTLEVHVYAGRDGSFAMVEDDGHSLAYSAQGTTRTTTWSWNDATHTLSWAVTNQGYTGGPQDFVAVDAVLFVANATGPLRAASRPLGNGGSVVFPARV